MVSQELPISVIIFCVVLQSLGCFLLGALGVTLALSVKLSDRDPVFRNFVYVSTLSAALSAFNGLALLSDPHGKTRNKDAVLELAVGSMELASILNLSLELIFKLRETKYPATAKARQIRMFWLVTTPYILSLVPVGILFTKSRLATNLFQAVIFLPISVAIIIIDTLILIYYLWSIQLLKKANIEVQTSLPFVFRVLGLGLYQLANQILATVGPSLDQDTNTLITLIRLSIFRLLSFCLLGLNMTTLQIWFPSFFRMLKERRASRDSERLQLTYSQTSSTIRIVDDE